MSADEKRTTLLQLAEKCLSSSRLIFLVADLRLLSSTGRINTKYESLCLDSDRFLRTTSQSMACLEDQEPEKGITASHVMAILLLEMNETIDEQRGTTPLGDDDDDYFNESGLLLNLRISRSDPILARKAESELHTLLRGYSVTLREDLCDSITKVHRHVVAQRSSFESDSPVNLPFSSLAIEQVASSRSHHNHFHKKQQIAREAATHELTALAKQIFDGATDSQSGSFYGRDELVHLIASAVARRDDDLLAFLDDFFKKGSVTRMMTESKTELVWLHDWHTQKECTYAISIDREENTVHVVFRGATTYADWDHAIHWKTTKIVNPIETDYPNKSEHIKLHGGYYRYLFRRRKDSRSTKYDEIASKVEFYGKRLCEDYRVVVTGHSLGGALSTIFSFFASLEERFTRHKPIQVVTFGCPKVAAYQFVDAIRNQEDAGKLQVARFHNEKDASKFKWRSDNSVRPDLLETQLVRLLH
jgi:Lipase (class 3)